MRFDVFDGMRFVVTVRCDVDGATKIDVVEACQAIAREMEVEHKGSTVTWSVDDE